MEEEALSSPAPDYRTHDEIGLNAFLVRCVCVVSLASCLLGYDIGVMSGAILFIERDLGLSDVQQEIVIGSLNIVSAVGALLAGITSDALGRKKTVMLAAVIFTIGAIGMACSFGFWTLLLFRAVTGVGVGVGLVLAPLYVAELSPSSFRGNLVSLGEVTINLGILLGYVSNYVFKDLPDFYAWRVMIGAGAVPSVLLFVGVWFMPESPRWLMSKGRKEEAVSVFEQADYPPAKVEEMVAEVEEALRIAEEQKAVSWMVLLCPTPSVRSVLIIGLGINFFQQATGCESAVYYAPKIMQAAGLEGENSLLLGSVVLGLIKLACIFPPMLLMERFGRKPFLIVSTFGMFIANYGLAIAFVNEDDPMPAVAFSSLVLFMASFSFGIGPINWVVTSEVFPLRLRGRAMSLATLVNRITSGSVALGFLSLTRAITTMGAYLLFAGISFISIAFVTLILPETNNMTLEEIELLFSKKEKGEEQYGSITRGDHVE